MIRTRVTALLLLGLVALNACGKAEHPANDPSSAVTPGGPDAGVDPGTAGAPDTGK